MSISAALSNAISGLTAVSRGAEVVSSNLANALTPGYAARELQLSSRTLIGNGGGVKVEGVLRLVPAEIVADNRIANSRFGYSDTLNSLHVTMESAFGTANQDDSLTSIITAFDSALIFAAAAPENDVRLQGVVDAAKDLSNKINSIAMELQKARTISEKSIENDVNRLNSALGEVARLNRLVTIAQAKGQDASSLIDARQSTLDSISDIIPIKEIPRSGGAISLFTQGGATLLDGSEPIKVTFTAHVVVTPQMSAAAGQLGFLSIDGVSLTESQMVMFKGGSLEANFLTRDRLIPEYQSGLDKLASDLYHRLADPSVDLSLQSGDPGLFADRQAAFDPQNTLGFSSRISISIIVDETQGGHLWKVRTGLQASAPGPVSDSSLLNRIQSAFSSTSSTPGNGQAQSIFKSASDLLSAAATNRVRAETGRQHDSTYRDTVKASLLSHGVDRDKEMAQLLQLEKNYAANAKVIQAIGAMLDEILRIS
ncbi:flagellar hook-associated protein FlgK [Paracoccus aminophilus]|uniref:Flagellar hook-associated protein 1 n=1 Tax=Paracoccus aminophilus JCM 7686 TaxID=1367847 RepID=S5Z1I8_PARAH|nr:flagellar hook-associated protein FlgK [Paracoccus aminophilus]AGT11311.1 flagellar hook-associated protein, FlgK [Paracoccus aminophilus JCM 7686]